MASLIRNYAARVTSKVPARRTSLALISSAALAGAALPALGLLAGTASAATKICTLPVSGVVTCVFGYDGTATNWPVPAGITTLNVTADGAQGGSTEETHGQGGKGGEMKATLTNVPADTTLSVFPGGEGVTSGAGGLNQGPISGTSGGGNSGVAASEGSSGGGASTVALTPLSPTPFDRILVAAGAGGGGAGDFPGGNGGTAAHPDGDIGGGGSPGGGGTTTSGGDPGSNTGLCTTTGVTGGTLTGGTGGGGVPPLCVIGGGGGGSGYYGGGGGGAWGVGLDPVSVGGGGGGSSFPASVTTVGGITVTPDTTDGTLWSGGNGQVTISYTMIPTTTTVNCTPNPSTVGQNVTCTATISPSDATGTVEFQDGASTIGGCAAVPVTTGSAACSTTGLTAGSHTITATYTPTTESGWEGSSNTTNQVVKIATTTTLQSSLNPSTYGQSVTLTATVSPTDGGGTVDFKNGSSDITNCTSRPLVDVSGQYEATCTTSGLPVGSNSLTAVYSGDSGYAGSTSDPVDQVVNPLPTHLRVWLVVHANGTYTLFAQLTSGGSGVNGQAIHFNAGRSGPALCTAGTDSSGIAHCYLDWMETHELLRYWGAFTASYGGGGNYAAASAFYPGIFWWL